MRFIAFALTLLSLAVAKECCSDKKTSDCDKCVTQVNPVPAHKVYEEKEEDKTYEDKEEKKVEHVSYKNTYKHKAPVAYKKVEECKEGDNKCDNPKECKGDECKPKPVAKPEVHYEAYEPTYESNSYEPIYESSSYGAVPQNDSTKPDNKTAVKDDDEHEGHDHSMEHATVSNAIKYVAALLLPLLAAAFII